MVHAHSLLLLLLRRAVQRLPRLRLLLMLLQLEATTSAVLQATCDSRHPLRLPRLPRNPGNRPETPGTLNEISRRHLLKTGEVGPGTAACSQGKVHVKRRKCQHTDPPGDPPNGLHFWRAVAICLCLTLREQPSRQIASQSTAAQKGRSML